MSSVGVVVIGRNEGERLARCLASIGPAIVNTVYVDSDSTDNSPEIARLAGTAVLGLDSRMLFTAARARNAGFGALKELLPDVEFVQFLDGDCELDQDWMSVAADFLLSHPRIAVVCGRRRERFPGRSIYNRLCDMEWNTTCGETSSSGGDLLIRAAAFDDVGGFRAALMAGEEPELCSRLRHAGWKIWRLDAEMTRHDANILSFRQWWWRVVRTGYGYAEVSQLLRNTEQRTYTRELLRAVFWGGAFPLLVVALSVFTPMDLLLLLAYPAQLLRIAQASSACQKSDAYAYALFLMIGKFAEFQGILKFCWSRIFGQAHRPIEYKTR